MCSLFSYGWVWPSPLSGTANSRALQPRDSPHNPRIDLENHWRYMRSPKAIWETLRSREESRLFLMAAYLLLVITCYTATKAVRDSLFVTEVGTWQLPYLYMLIACFMALISSFYPGLLRRKGLFALIRRTSILA